MQIVTALFHDLEGIHWHRPQSSRASSAIGQACGFSTWVHAVDTLYYVYYLLLTAEVIATAAVQRQPRN